MDNKLALVQWITLKSLLKMKEINRMKIELKKNYQSHRLYQFNGIGCGIHCKKFNKLGRKKEENINLTLESS